MNSKILSLSLVFIITIGSIGVTIVGAQSITSPHEKQTDDIFSFFQWFQFPSNGVTVDDLIDQWNDIQTAKEELRSLLESYGIELPELSKDQKKEIFRTIREQRRQGATREEIRAEIIDLLIGYGIDLPNLPPEQREEIRETIKTMLETEYGFVFVELSPEQKAYIKQRIITMKRQDASKEEITEAIIELYESYGGYIPELTDAQREDMHEWIVSILETEYGLDLPNLTFEQRQEIKEKKEEIRELSDQLRDLLKEANRLTRFRFYRYVHKNR